MDNYYFQYLHAHTCQIQVQIQHLPSEDNAGLPYNVQQVHPSPSRLCRRMLPEEQPFYSVNEELCCLQRNDRLQIYF